MELDRLQSWFPANYIQMGPAQSWDEYRQPYVTLTSGGIKPECKQVPAWFSTDYRGTEAMWEGFYQQVAKFIKDKPYVFVRMLPRVTTWSLTDTFEDRKIDLQYVVMRISAHARLN